MALLHFDLDWSCQSLHCVQSFQCLRPGLAEEIIWYNPLQALGRPGLKRMLGVEDIATRNPAQRERERERFRRFGEGGKAPDRALW